MDEGSKNPKQVDIDAIIDRVVRQVLERERAKESTRLSSGTYSDQPILQRGSDWQRSVAGRGTKAPHPKTRSSEEQDDPTSDRSKRTASAHEEPLRPSRSQSPTNRHGAGGPQRQNDRSRKASDQQVIDYYSRLLDQEFGPAEGYGRGAYGYDASDYPRDPLLDEAFDEDVLAFGAAARGTGRPTAGQRHAGGSVSRGRSAPAHRPESPRGAVQRPATGPSPQRPTSHSYGSATADQGAWGRWPYGGRSDPHHKPEVELPPLLKKLRNLESSRDDDGQPLRGARLFVRQAQLARDFEDVYVGYALPAYHYLPTYAELSNGELRSYFTWRTQWRHGTNSSTPALWATLLAYEFIDGVGCEPGPEVVRRLIDLSNSVDQLGQWGAWSAVPGDLRRWARDYVVYYDLDPKLLGNTGNQAFGHAVMVFRHKERAILLQEGLLKSAASETATPGPQTTPFPASPTDEELWQATKELVSFDVDRSPFFRDHATAAAATWADVFSRMVVHCAKHRKVGYVDSLVGEEYAVPASPFAGVPFAPTAEPAEHTVHLDDAEWVSYRFGRWKYHRAFSYSSADADLGKLVHALDRQMRVTWGYPKQLKERKVPRYQQTFLTKACERVHGEEVRAREAAEEAERRKITFDFSKLSGIRAAAATTREALLVDEEREGYDPTGSSDPELAVGASGDAEPTVGIQTEAADQPDAASPHVEGAPSTGDATAPVGDGLPSGESAAQTMQAGEDSSRSPSPVDAAAQTTLAGGGPSPSPASADMAVRPKGGSSPNGAAAGARSVTCAPAEQQLPFDLTELEYQGALHLLDGKSLEGLLGPGTPSEEMLVDSINEKLFDELGDTAFEYSDQGPIPVEDYADDVRDLLAP